MFRVTPETRGFDRALDEFADKLQRPADTFGRVFEDWFYQTEGEQFETQGAAGRSGRWPSLSPASLKHKARAGRGSRILVDRGVMQAALTQRGGLGSLIERSGDTIIFRLLHPAGLHQTGTRRMSQRKVVDPSDAQVRQLGEDVKRTAVEIVRGLGIDAKG